MAMQLKKQHDNLALMVSGCSLSPAIPVIGAYYPSWFLRHCQPYFDAHPQASYSAGKYQSGICRNYLYRPFCSLRHAVLAGIFLIYLRRAHGKYAESPRSKFLPVVVALALVALAFRYLALDSAPSTNDAYASADTIDVVPEVSGRIVELAVTDNRAVKQGDLLFRIDRARTKPIWRKPPLAALDKQVCSPSVALTRNSLVPTRLMPR